MFQPKKIKEKETLLHPNLFFQCNDLEHQDKKYNSNC
jgi:hypothetical protein